MAELPRDIIMAILGRLVVKDLVCYRCVCKAWCSLIDDPDFIKNHLKHSNQLHHHHHHHVLLSCGSDLYWLNNSVLDKDMSNFESSEEEAVRLVQPLPQPLVDTERVYVLGSSCNGLLAVANHKGDMFLWNPFSTNYIRLPLPFTDAAYNYSKIKPYMIGFGYDPINDDYKLLIVVFIKGGGFCIEPHVRLFSLKAKTWKRINHFPVDFVNCRGGKGCGVLVGNALHWTAKYLMRRQIWDPIWAIDLVTEDFNRISMPDCVEMDKYSHVKLVELGGLLCLVCNVNDEDEDEDDDVDNSDSDSELVVGVDVWVMKEYGVKESWTKLFSMTGQGFNYLLPVAYLKTNHKVVLNYGHNSNKFVLYDMKEKRVEHLNVRINDFSIPPSSFLTTTFCVESLIGFDASYAQLKDWNEKEEEKEKQQANMEYRDSFGFRVLFIRDKY